MELVVSGWGRDHGERLIAKRDLIEARFSSWNGYERPEVYVETTEAKENWSFGVRAVPKGNVELRFYAKITLNGEYLVRQTMTRKEIARLFVAQYEECSFQEMLDVIAEVRENEPSRNFAPVMIKRVNEIGLSNDTVAWLIKNSILQVGELVQKTETEMQRLPSFEHHFVEVRDRLMPLGLQFGMRVKGWPAIPPVLSKELKDFELSVRAENCLKNDGIIYVGDLVTKTEAELLRTPYFGRKALKEIKDEVLTPLGLEFGMDFPNWRSPGK